MKRLRIGFVIDDGLDQPDGVQQYVLTLGRWLSSRGHSVHYLAGETKRTDIKNIRSMSRNLKVSFNANRLSSPFPVPKRRIKGVLETEQFDILHVQIPYSPFMAARVINAAPAGTKIVGTFHILPFGRLQKAAIYLLGLLLRRNSKRFELVFAVSEPAAELCQETFGLRASVLPNVVDSASLKPFRPPKTPRKHLKIVFMGRLVERKGGLQLIRAIHYLRKEKLTSNEFTVEMGGAGPQKREIEQLIARCGLKDIIRLKGFISETEKPGFLADADIAIFPSLGGESFGIVLIEAMAAGSGVVVGGENPGYRSVLSKTPEVIVNAQASEKIAYLLARLINEPSLRRKLHTKQQEMVKQFDVAIVGQKLEKYYQNLSKNRV